VFKTIVADLRSNADPSRRTGLDYWSRVLGKAIFAPTVHVVVLYRISSTLYQWRITRPISFILRSMSVVWGGTEIHPSVRIGPGFCLIHSVKVIIAANVTIGEDVRISHGVSIGGDPGRGARDTETIIAPVIGDHVTIGMDSIIMGPVTVGDHSVIGAQSLVIHDIPAYSVAAGSPARVLRRLDNAPD
jgi:serine O-acetyltransferase